MKILVVHNFHRRGGGSDDAVVASSRLLRERGHDVQEFVVDSSDIPLGFRGRLQAFTSGIYSRSSVGLMRQALRDARPDVVHVHEVYPLLSPWVLPVCRESGTPVVMTCHDFRLTCPVATHYSHGRICTDCLDHNELWCCFGNCRGNLAESIAFAARSASARLSKVVVSNVDVFVTATDFTRTWLVDHLGLSPQLIDTVPYAIALPDETAQPSTGRYVGFAGRFVPEKGIDVVIEAARQAQVPLRLAGDASSMPDLAVAGDIEFTGLLDATALASFYAGARMVVVPSTWFETFGIVAGEAMAHGVPVVASRIGALNEVVDDGVTGLVFEPGDANDLAVKIRTLWDDPERCSALGAGGRSKVQQRYSADAHCHGLIGAYSKAIEIRRSAERPSS
jgi:glycosyltransferase involved in cell wall biosynthesis